MGLFDRSALFRAGRAGIVVAALALALSACGRNGPLEPPPGAAVANGANGAAADDPNAGKPQRSFVLDPLVR